MSCLENLSKAEYDVSYHGRYNGTLTTVLVYNILSQPFMPGPDRCFCFLFGIWIFWWRCAQQFSPMAIWISGKGLMKLPFRIKTRVFLAPLWWDCWWRLEKTCFVLSHYKHKLIQRMCHEPTMVFLEFMPGNCKSFGDTQKVGWSSTCALETMKSRSSRILVPFLFPLQPSTMSTLWFTM